MYRTKFRHTFLSAIILLGISSFFQANAFAGCDPFGIITGSNFATITLGILGCAINPPDVTNSAIVVPGASIITAGNGIVGSPGIPWNLANFGQITSTNISGALLGGGVTVINGVTGVIEGAFTGLSLRTGLFL